MAQSKESFKSKASIKYYSYQKCLSYQRFINIITGGRGIGKTYGKQCINISRFLKDGSQFVWLRRFKTEIKTCKDGFFNKVQKEFPDVKFEIKGNNIFINKKLAGCFCALTGTTVNKGNSKLNKVRSIDFDEYIIDTTDVHHRYLNDEMRKLFDLVETFGRLDDIQVFLLSNNVSKINPCYLMFDINFKNSNIWVNELIYAEQCETPKEFLEVKSKTKLTQLIQKYDKEYYNYNVNNQSLTDDNTFIKTKDKNAIQAFNIKTKDNIYKIYKGRYKNKPCFFCSLKGNEQILTYTFDVLLVNDSKILYADKNSLPIKNLINVFKRGMLFFDNEQIKANLIEILKKYVR